ncbi:MAG: hypothetical protein V4550_04165 [Gemmatimonadota bacterium]
MSDEHRFSDDEVARILERAAARETDIASRAAGTGLTLAELQAVAVQVGIAPERIAVAAREVVAPNLTAKSSTFMGAPTSVARTVYTERRMSDDEWLQLVVLLRETFDAPGNVSAVGPLRSWTNGNLQIHEEPWADGFRIRMSTRNDLGVASALGVIFATLGSVMLLKVIPKANPAGIAIAGLFIAGGIGQIISIRLSIGRWGRTRAAQMEALAAQITRLLDSSRD